MKTIREFREAKGIKQVAVADHIGVSRATYAKYEENQEAMSIGQARVVCSFLGCSLNDIFLSSKVK